MEIHQLEQFETIANSRTMREAADKLFLSQPALSQNLKKLETELGCTLFDRSHNQLKLTPYGEILLARVHRILFDLREVQAEIDAQREADAQKVRIGSFYVPLDIFIMPQIERAFSSYSFAIEVTRAKDLARMLEDELIDIAFIPEQFAYAHKQSIPVYEESLYISLPPRSPFASAPSVSYESMKSFEYLLPEDLPGLSAWYEETLKAAKVPGASITRLPSKEYLEAMDRTEKAHLSTSLLSLFMGAGAMRPSVAIEGTNTKRCIVVSYDSENEKAASIAEFIDKNRRELFSSHAFLPFLLYRDTALLD